jgi:hypothetical protein
MVVLTVAGILGQPSWLIPINGGGCFNSPASVKPLTVVVVCYAPASLMFFKIKKIEFEFEFETEFS